MSEESLLDSVKSVPRATPGGAQEGRETPKQRKQKMLAALKAENKAEAGDIPPEVLEFEKANGIPSPGPAKNPEPPAERQIPASLPKPSRPRKPRTHVEKSERRKAAVSMEIEGAGTFKTPAYGVVDANFGFFIVLPKGADAAIFIPNPGTRVRLSAPEFGLPSADCFFPGISAEIPGLDACVLAFVKTDG